MNNNIADFFSNKEEQAKQEQEREAQQKQLGDQTIASSASIREQVNNVRKYVQIHKREPDMIDNASIEFADFKLTYPTLFKKICDNTCDRQQLEMLLQRLEQIQSSQKTQYDASVEVGQILVDKYVKPKLEEKERENKQATNRKNRSNDLH